jgi:hypothetical protein
MSEMKQMLLQKQTELEKERGSRKEMELRVQQMHNENLKLREFLNSLLAIKLQ